jgi:GNAT superfamily N-acetyltransferase
MNKIIRTDSRNNDFIELVKLLDRDIAERDETAHARFGEFNTIEKLNYVVVIYDNNLPVGCGAIKKFNENSTEVKRMFLKTEYRGKNFATKILQELEEWSKEMQFERCVLQTSHQHPEAIRFYKKSGYVLIDNYGAYNSISDSLCFEKYIKGKVS